ncbi:hypothetical protein QJS10_CPB11g00877 [Acorus calamus]|uniref:Uncharacterized protein n=1 Tax=Acorus calamus TaxID=4465 RepID=A0AAV9DSA1_ACOCL|nr:hypothetical protein QJS10_CPB11g00877 [Acorus calamus]
MNAKKRAPPPPDPVAVLRGHRATVMDACFHPSKPLLFTGTPSVTFKTSSYHFCKLSLVQFPSCSAQFEHLSSADAANQPEGSYDLEEEDACEEGMLDEKFSRMSTESTIPTEAVISNDRNELLVLAGEDSSEVEVWDLNSAERLAR